MIAPKLKSVQAFTSLITFASLFLLPLPQRYRHRPAILIIIITPPPPSHRYQNHPASISIALSLVPPSLLLATVVVNIGDHWSLVIELGAAPLATESRHQYLIII
jgi:hypothetical protein